MKKINFQILVLLPFFYAYSYFLISSYVYGDQLSYRALYNALAHTDFLDVVDVSAIYISASDFLSSYILWVPATLGVDKDVFISVANTVLLSCIYIIAKNHRVGNLMIFLIMGNFYVIVLMTGAERLKFAIILLLLAEIIRNKVGKISFSVFSIFAHAQSLILLGALFLGRYGKNTVEMLKTFKLRRSGLIGFISVFSVVVAILFIQKEGVTVKAQSYLKDSIQLGDIVPILFFIGAGLILLKNKYLFFFTMAPLLFAIILIGGSRVNMIAVILGVLLFWKENKQNHPFMFFLMGYFFIKSIPFVEKIFVYGNGFHGI